MKKLSVTFVALFSLFVGSILDATDETTRLQDASQKSEKTEHHNTPPVIPTAKGQWSVQQANDWLDQQGWLVGFNYVPSYASNTTEMWQHSTFNLKCIDRELGWAEDIGYNSLRVFVPYIVWKKDPSSFKRRFELFLRCADKHGLRVMPVLFDDCSFGDPKQLDPRLGEQRELQPGMPFFNWTPCPGETAGGSLKERRFLKRYVQDMIGTHAQDQRINCWDLFNEPTHSTQVGNPTFLQTIFEWARGAHPSQPLTVAFWTIKNDLNTVILANSDIVTFHGYAPNAILDIYITVFGVVQRPVLCTEWMARIFGSDFETDLPLFANRGVGCYQWGLVNGRTQAQFPWGNEVGGSVDPTYGWLHDILYSDGTPYRVDEVETIKKTIQDNRELMLLK